MVRLHRCSWRIRPTGAMRFDITTGTERKVLKRAEAMTWDGSYSNKTMLAVEIPLIVVAICTVALRVYSRLGINRKLAVDDVLIICGAICAFGRTVISCMSADDREGFDRKGPDQPIELPFYKHIFERRIVYILAVTFARLSVLTYYLRIFPPQLTQLRRLSFALLFLAVVQFIEVFTVLVVSCRSIGKLWTSDWRSFSGSQCFSSPTYSYSAAVGDSVVDSLIFALPLRYVWQLSKLKIGQRIGLVVVFGLGLIVCAVALLQIPFIRRREGNGSYFGGAINLLIAVQISLAIVAASLPDLRALVSRSFPKLLPLHHRSLAPARVDGVGLRDLEHAGRGQDMQESRERFEARRVSRKPDRLRNSLPASLMETRATHTEITRALSEEVRGLPVRTGR